MDKIAMLAAGIWLAKDALEAGDFAYASSILDHHYAEAMRFLEPTPTPNADGEK